MLTARGSLNEEGPVNCSVNSVTTSSSHTGRPVIHEVSPRIFVASVQFERPFDYRFFHTAAIIPIGATLYVTVVTVTTTFKSRSDSHHHFFTCNLKFFTSPCIYVVNVENLCTDLDVVLPKPFNFRGALTP